MCGLVGAIGELTNKHEKAVESLLIVDSLRGIDSTGIAVVGRGNNDVKLAKQVGDPYNLFNDVRFSKAMAGVNRVIIGHNRFGTQGKATKANAHPFEFEGLVGAHNGTLTNKYRMLNGNDFQVDSQALYNHIDQNGVKDFLKIAEGAWALTWWDKDTSEFNMLRNDQRPLWRCYTKDLSVMFWASEAWMLHGILGREGIEYNTVESVPVDTLIRIAVEPNGKLGKPHVSAAEATIKKGNVTHFTVGRSQQQQHWNHNSTITGATASNPPAVVSGVRQPAPLVIVKKEGVVPGTASNQTQYSRSGFGGSKNVLLELGNEIRQDEDGNRYIQAWCHDHKYAVIRWYYGRSINTLDYFGEFVMADISEMYVRGSYPSYYKAVDSSVKLIEDVVESMTEEEGKEDPEYVNDEELFENAKGNKVSYNEWMAQHGECNYCGAPILPTDKHGFGADNFAYCEGCVDEKNLSQILRLRAVVAAK